MKKKMLSTSRVIKIGFDIDEVLLECSKPAIEWANKRFGTNLSFDDLDSWGKSGDGYDKMQLAFKDENFVLSQEPIEGATEFIERLSNVIGVEIYFITAVPVELTSARSKSLMKNFPWVPTSNYILTSSKEVAYFDIFVDDAEHNLFKNKSKYPIVKRAKWNSNITGMLGYSSFEELWVLINSILRTEGVKNVNPISEPSVFAIIGPTGSGKNSLAEELCQYGMYRPKTYTNSEYDARNKNYIYVPSNEFKKENFFMTTTYGKNVYGVPEANITNALSRGKNVVMVVDMCGYAALAARFPTVSIFKDESYENNVRNILQREMPDEEKANRIMSIKREKENMALCDYLLPQGEDVKTLAQRVINTIN